MYSLCVLDERTHEHITVKEMNEAEYQDLRGLIVYLDSVFSSDIKYEMIRRNDQAFLQYCESLGPANIHDGEVFVEINRLIENVVNSFYSWIGLHEKHFNQIFRDIKGGYFDNNEEYRLAYGLRIFCDHYALSFRTFSVKLDTGDVILDIDPKPIWEAKKSDEQFLLNDKIRDTLKEKIDHEDNIHLRELVIGLDLILHRFERDIMKAIWNELKPRIESVIAPIRDIATRLIYVNKNDEDKPVIGNLVAPINTFFETLEKFGARIPQEDEGQ